LLRPGCGARFTNPLVPASRRFAHPREVQVGMRAARNRGFLWRITNDGRNSYLYGTLHGANPDVHQL
jgi:uncharacterized protein